MGQASRSYRLNSSLGTAVLLGLRPMLCAPLPRGRDVARVARWLFISPDVEPPPIVLDLERPLLIRAQKQRGLVRYRLTRRGPMLRSRAIAR
jgi:hypothetical protein